MDVLEGKTEGGDEGTEIRVELENCLLFLLYSPQRLRRHLRCLRSKEI